MSARHRAHVVAGAGRIAAAAGLFAACSSAHAQAAPPAAAASAPLWNVVYRQCIQQSSVRRAPQGIAPVENPLPVFEQVRNDCADRLPSPGPELSQLTIDSVAAAVRLDLASLLRKPPAASAATSAPRPTMQVGDGGTCPQPDYPAAALRAMATGSTTIRLRVGGDGQVVGGDIAVPSGPTREHRLLDGTAVDTFTLCRFPATGLARTLSLRFNWRIEP